jgi:hypothetical protein
MVFVRRALAIVCIFWSLSFVFWIPAQWGQHGDKELIYALIDLFLVVAFGGAALLLWPRRPKRRNTSS